MAAHQAVSIKQILSIVITIAHCIVWIHATWVKSNINMDRLVDEAAVGFYDNEVYIFGGDINGQQVIRYNVTGNTFEDDGTSVLSVSITGRSQYYHQYGNVLYFIHNNAFAIYNFETKQFIPNWMNINIPNSVSKDYERACLVATNDYLFVIGSFDNCGSNCLLVTSTVQILNILNQSWVYSNMNEARNKHACAADTVTNKLYAIGGTVTEDDSNPNFVDSIEMSDITDIATEPPTWTLLDDTLHSACYGLRALVHEPSHKIFVVGGYRADGNALDTVHIIDTINNQVVLSSDRLPYKVTTTAALTVRNTLYCFGGWRPNNGLNTWIYSIMPSTDEPSESTSRPTGGPSNEPTSPPSHEPSNESTSPPSGGPSNESTSPPTDEPSNEPTSRAVNHTTALPTNEPSPQSTTAADTTQEPSLSLSTTQAQNQRLRPDTDTTWMIWVIVGGVVAVLICILLYTCYYIQRKAPVYEDTQPVNIQKSEDTQEVVDQDEVHSSTSNDSMYINPVNPTNGNEEADAQEPGEHRNVSNVEDINYAAQRVVEEWLKKIGLSEYCDTFVSNGYDAMVIMKDITEASQLEEIGIVSKGHQQLILAEIRKLKKPHKVHTDDGGHKEVRVVVYNEAEAMDDEVVPTNDDDARKEVRVVVYNEAEAMDDETVPTND